MFGEQLVDLDELVLRCRDDQARQYIAEAVACYKVGAFRSSIVATWIAVIFDFIYKLRELELTGDKNAQQKLAEFEKIRRDNDISGSLLFEKKILDLAKDEFQLLSPLEYTDLSRLLDDRNRCAHPSMNSIEDIYQPSAELVRYHLRNAVSYLLQKPPVQGKAAIDWLLNEVNSVYFPVVPDLAAKSFMSGPLSRPTEALVRNFVIVLIKALFSGTLDESAERRYFAAINAMRQMQRVVTEKTIESRLNDILKNVPDTQFGLSMRFLHYVSDTWQYVHDDVRMRMNTYIKEMPSDDLVPNLLVALRTKELQPNARERLGQKMEIAKLVEIVAADTEHQLKHEFIGPMIAMYQEAANFYTANEISTELIIPMIDILSPDQIERIIIAGKTNAQVNKSYEFTTVLKKIVESQIMNVADVTSLLQKHELEKFTEKIVPQTEEGDIPF